MSNFVPVYPLGTEEPTVVGTLIMDGEGDFWVRVLPSGTGAPWYLCKFGRHEYQNLIRERWSVWSAIPGPMASAVHIP